MILAEIIDECQQDMWLKQDNRKICESKLPSERYRDVWPIGPRNETKLSSSYTIWNWPLTPDPR